MVCVIESDSWFIVPHAQRAIATRLLSKQRAPDVCIPRYLNARHIRQWLEHGVPVSAFAVHAMDVFYDQDNVESKEILEVISEYGAKVGWGLDDIIDFCPIHVYNSFQRREMAVLYSLQTRSK